jgi:hypothetical protein
MHRLSTAIALGQIAPMCPGSQNPQTPVHKQSVTQPRPTGIANLAAQQQLNFHPLQIVQLVPPDPIVRSDQLGAL